MKSALPKSPSHKFLKGAPTEALERHAGSKKPQLSGGTHPIPEHWHPNSYFPQNTSPCLLVGSEGVRMHT